MNWRLTQNMTARMGKSQALSNFENRLTEIQQLLDAHSALTRLKKAESLIAGGNKDLNTVAEAVKVLVQETGRGRPKEVQALNAAGIALLSAHLQGYITDVYAESAASIFSGQIEDIQAILDIARTRANPNAQNIITLFKSLGFTDILDGLSWQKLNNKNLRAKLNDFTKLRNEIVHGKSTTVHKSQLQGFYETWATFGVKFDAHLAHKIKAQTSRSPW